MHEASLVARLLEVVAIEAKRHGLSRVDGLTLRVGALCQAAPEQMQAAFEVMSRDTLAAGAALRIESVPVRVRCEGCGAEAQVEPWDFACPGCGRAVSQILSGQELELVELSGDQLAAY